MTYRLNYGNGQVGVQGSISEVRRAFKAQKEFDVRHRQSSGGLRIERYIGEGEWETVQRLEENPKTPPKNWWTRCVDGVSESGSRAATPEQVCGSLWYHKMSASDKRRITREAEGVQSNPLDTTSALAGVGILTAVILFIGSLKK